jgi:hypothetical protein
MYVGRLTPKRSREEMGDDEVSIIIVIIIDDGNWQ